MCFDPIHEREEVTELVDAVEEALLGEGVDWKPAARAVGERHTLGGEIDRDHDRRVRATARR